MRRWFIWRTLFNFLNASIHICQRYCISKNCTLVIKPPRLWSTHRISYYVVHISVRASKTICYRDISSIYLWIFAKPDFCRLCISGQWWTDLVLGPKYRRSRSHYRDEGVQRSTFPLSSAFYSVSQKNPVGDLTFFPKRLKIFNPNFTRLLHVPIYARLQFFIQLSPTVTKLCYIKCDHPFHIIWTTNSQPFGKNVCKLQGDFSLTL